MKKYLLAAILAATYTMPSTATVLTFVRPDGSSFGNGVDIPATYGHRVSALSDAVGSYGMGNGFTPGVSIAYGNDAGSGFAAQVLSGWTTQYDVLTDVAYSSITGPVTHIIEFSADSGLLVTLNSFDWANYQSRASSATFEVRDGANNLLWSDTYSVSGGTSSLVNFAPNVSASTLRLQIEGDFFNAAIDNINFDQEEISGVPEPSSAILVACGAALVALRRKFAR